MRRPTNITIVCVIILIIVAICVFAFNGNKNKDNDIAKVNTQEVDNNIADNKSNNVKSNVIGNNVDENTVNNIQNNISEEPAKNEILTPTETFTETPQTAEEKAIGIVRDDWKNEGATFSVTGMDANGNYIVQVTNSDTVVLAFYTVNVADGSFTKREMN